MSIKRWKAVLVYRTNAGPVDIEHFVEEIEELQHIIERGPDWDCLVRCTVTLARKHQLGLTVEEAAEL